MDEMLSVESLVNYLRIDNPSEIEITEISRMKDSAIAYCTSYTGMSIDDLMACDDMKIAVCVIVADMFDNRNYTVEKCVYHNKLVETILNMHSRNLL